MTDKYFEIMLTQLDRISKYSKNGYLIWSYFDLIQTLLMETGFQEPEGGDGKKYYLSLPNNMYNLMSFTIGPVRVLGIGHSTKQEIGLSFICLSTVIEQLVDKKQAPIYWGNLKNKKLRGKQQYLTIYPSDLLEPGAIRAGWIKAVHEIVSLRWNNHIVYHRHRPIIFRAAMDKEIRAQIFKEAGLEVRPEWKQ